MFGESFQPTWLHSTLARPRPRNAELPRDGRDRDAGELHSRHLREEISRINSFAASIRA